VKVLTAESPDAAFHAVRISSKRARYAAEAVAPLFGRDSRRFADAMAEVQSVLGDHQDTAVAEQWLRDAAKDVPSARLVIGELVAIERLERLRLRKKFKSVWKKASRRRLRTWFD
jgi:CHAD domain-containing protein